MGKLSISEHQGECVHMLKANVLDEPQLTSLDRALQDGPNTLVAPRLAAPIVNSSVSTLARWRMTGDGPRWIKISRSKVAYKAQDLLEFINSKRIAA